MTDFMTILDELEQNYPWAVSLLSLMLLLFASWLSNVITKGVLVRGLCTC